MRRLRTLIVLLCSIAVGAVFIVAGSLKSLDVEGFAHDIALHKIAGPALSALLARVLVPVEIVAGAAAIIGYRRRLALIVLLGMLAVFIGATGWAWYHGNTEGCGCFGRYANRTPLEVIEEDLLLAAACLVGIALSSGGSSRSRALAGAPTTDPRSAPASEPGDRRDNADSVVRPAGWSSASHVEKTPTKSTGGGGGSAARTRWPWGGGLRGTFLGVVALAAIAFTLASPSLPIDSFATALRDGVTLHDLGLDQIAGGLADGDRLLAILVLDEEASRAAVAPLNELALRQGVPRITALTAATEHARAEFFWSYAPSFDLLEVPSADLRRLYRRAPRIFRVHNGRVLRVWDGIPTAEDLTQ